MAEVLRNLGSERVWIVHGGDGLDEMTTTAPTRIVELKNGEIRAFEVTPEDVGLARADPAALKGGDAAHNAAALRAVLEGARDAHRDIAVFNAAGALVVAGSGARPRRRRRNRAACARRRRGARNARSSCHGLKCVID